MGSCNRPSHLWFLQVPQLPLARRSFATRSVPLERWPEYSLCSGRNPTQAAGESICDETFVAVIVGCVINASRGWWSPNGQTVRKLQKAVCNFIFYPVTCQDHVWILWPRKRLMSVRSCELSVSHELTLMKFRLSENWTINQELSDVSAHPVRWFQNEKSDQVRQNMMNCAHENTKPLHLSGIFLPIHWNHADVSQ